MNEISNQKSADIPTQNNVRRWLTPRSSENVDKPHPFLTIFPHGEATIAHIRSVK